VSCSKINCHSQDTDVYASGEIRTHNPSKRAATGAGGFPGVYIKIQVR